MNNFSTIIDKAIEGGWFREYFTPEHSFRNSWDYSERNKTNPRGYFRIDGNKACLQFLGDTDIVCDPLFWKALANKCVWSSGDWRENAIQFHRINLTDGWNSAVSWLLSVVER